MASISSLHSRNWNNSTFQGIYSEAFSALVFNIIIIVMLNVDEYVQ